MHPSLLFAFGFLISEISSFTVINNVTVHKSVLQEIFFNEIKHSSEEGSGFMQESRQYDSQKCLLSLREIVSRFPSENVLPFVDAWGHLPSGILYGNKYDIGNFDQCVTTSVSLKEPNHVVNGQFCFANVPLQKNLGAVNVGICVPDTCSPEYLTSVFKNSANTALNGVLSEISVGHCTDGKIPPLRPINIVAISIFSIVTALMILSSIYEFCMDYYKKTPIPVLLAFSVLTNGKKLFAINTKRSRNSIDCFNGIRVLSTFWIMYHHTYSNIYQMPVINQKEYNAYGSSFVAMTSFMAGISVDSFFFIGGLLVAWSGFRDLDKSKGKINVFMNIVHRYIRLTPIVAVGLLLVYGINKLLYTGPFRDIVLALNKCDGYNWWPILLYIQNYYFQETSCYEESWYLAVDFHLYVLSPLLLIPMWKWGKKIIPIVGVLIVASIGWVMAVFFMEGYTGLTIGANFGEWNQTYVPTHTRCAPWLIGFVFGYFMHYNRQTNFRVSQLLQSLAWIGSFVIMIAIVFGPYFTLHAHGEGTVFEAAMYEGLKRVGWTTAILWITFACHYGFGGFVDTFLSHPYWQPLARLSYALYLMHMAVERIHFGMTRTVIYFSVYNQFLYFWMAFGITLLISIYVTLAFESPILILEKFIFGGGKPTKEAIREQEQPVLATIMVDPQQKIFS